jgi:hypothetical protein
MPDWDLLYRPQFTAGLGAAVLVTLEIGSASYADVPAFDMARGALVEGQESPAIEDTRPGVRFYGSDLAALGISPADLNGARVEMNGRAFRVESQLAIGSPVGEEAGEIGCILAEIEVTT